jgi:hypothetical protein
MKRTTWLVLLAALVLSGCSDLLGRGHRYGTVSLLTTEAGGTPLGGVTVRLYRHQYLLGEGVTDGNGVHEFPFIPRGPLELRAVAPAGWMLAPDAVTEFDDWIARGQRVHVELVFVRIDVPASP